MNGLYMELKLVERLFCLSRGLGVDVDVLSCRIDASGNWSGPEGSSHNCCFQCLWGSGTEEASRSAFVRLASHLQACLPTYFKRNNQR